MQQGGNLGDRAEMKEPSAPWKVQESICRGQICHESMALLLQWVMVRDGLQAQGPASECKTHLCRKWGRNTSGFGTTSHFCTQKSCQSCKNTTDPEYKPDRYEFTIPKILGLESSSR